MPRNGSGSYSLVTNSWNPATNGNSATAADWQALINDLASAVDGSVAADGQTPMTGNLQMGNNKTTGLAAATGLGDGLRLENIIAGADIASASTVTIPLEGNFFKVTGTTGITGFASTRGGRSVWVTFSGILTLTNSSSFYMPNASDITTAAGDIGLFVYDGTAWHCVLYRPLNTAEPAFSAYLNVNQTVTANVWTKIAFDTKAFDTNTNFSLVNSRFTPTVAGYYQINLCVLFGGSGINGACGIHKNGNIISNGNSTPTGSGASNIVSVSSILVYCNGTTDYIEGYVNTGGTSVLASVYSTYMNGFLARRA